MPGPSGSAQLNLTQPYCIYLRQKEHSPSSEDSAQSCEMIRTLNVVTLLQRSQRRCGMQRWREKMCVHVRRPVSQPLSSSSSFLPPRCHSFPRPLPREGLFSRGKLNQTAWIKAIIQFVYKASFILCQASAPLTVGGLLTSDLCWGLMMHLLQCSTRVFQPIIRRQDENLIIQICATL